MSVVISPNMLLPIPVVGQESGPDYANDINSCLNQVDQHTHTAGSGVQITPAAININADLPFNDSNATTLRSVRMTPQSLPLTASAPDLNCVYVSGADLYYNDGSGNQVQITAAGNVAGTPGSIANLNSPASASYVSANSTFVWQSAANTPASMDAASLIMRNLVANSFKLTLTPPSSMTGDTTLTLPTIPASTSFLTVDTAGNITATPSVTAGITSSFLASNAVTTAKITDQSVTKSKEAAMAAVSNTAGIGQLVVGIPFTVSTNATSATALGNVVTLTTTGRPVMVGLATPYGNTNLNTTPMRVNIPATTSGQLIIVNTTTGKQTGAGYSQSAIAGQTFSGCPVWGLDVVPAGTYTYQLYIWTGNGANAISVTNGALFAYEL